MSQSNGSQLLLANNDSSQTLTMKFEHSNSHWKYIRHFTQLKSNFITSSYPQTLLCFMK